MKLIVPALLTVALFTASTPRLNAQQFAPPVLYNLGPRGAMPQAARVGDFNHDGIADVAMVGNTHSLFSVSLGNGDGTFQAAIHEKLPPVGTTPKDLAVGDFNNDGIADVVTLLWNSDPQPGWAVIRLGNGDGTFRAGSQFTAGMSVWSLAVADFNGDGNLDVAVVATSTNGVSVSLGNGDGTFQPSAIYNSAEASMQVTSGDLNGDGFPDLMEINQDHTISVLLNSGTGAFPSATNYTFSTSQTLNSLQAGDLNGDGKPDVAICIESSQASVAVLLNNGDGTLGAPTFFKIASVGSGPLGIVIADFNLDGKPDLATVDFNGASALLYGNGDGSFQNPVKLDDGPSRGLTLATADFDNDGAPDLAFGIQGPRLSVLLNTQ